MAGQSRQERKGSTGDLGATEDLSHADFGPRAVALAQSGEPGADGWMRARKSLEDYGNARTSGLSIGKAPNSCKTAGACTSDFSRFQPRSTAVESINQWVPEGIAHVSSQQRRLASERTTV